MQHIKLELSNKRSRILNLGKSHDAEVVYSSDQQCVNIQSNHFQLGIIIDLGLVAQSSILDVLEAFY
ncbi:hypothetical protein Q4E40_18235 [Pontibacter sp. BT731]|uniref:hypothetical protein n=1 Tax=Pontibacter coccineus TaxID=3063328 RepID=UPI0026E40A62|nr:hypothetical protein [Pontibacter sp. BT731]MDO6392080.1 hypothetical protein [Pontibacter sp. BT731]